MGRYIKRQITMLHFWWRIPAKGMFDITPKTPAHKVFGSHMHVGNGAFRPTLADVVTGRAMKQYWRI